MINPKSAIQNGRFPLPAYMTKGCLSGLAGKKDIGDWGKPIPSGKLT
jgi:hypothetical protein